MSWVAKLFAGLGIAVAFLLVFGAVFVFTAYNESKPYIEHEYPTRLYERTDACSTPCTSNQAQDGWSVPEGANEVRFELTAVIESPTGPAHIVVADPSGDVVFDRIVTANAQESLSWAPEAGEWTITRTYAGVRGSIVIDVWSEGIPPGSL